MVIESPVSTMRRGSPSARSIGVGGDRVSAPSTAEATVVDGEMTVVGVAVVDGAGGTVVVDNAYATVVVDC